MTLDELIARLQELRQVWPGDAQVDVLTEDHNEYGRVTGQAEQPLGDLAVSNNRRGVRIKLLPEGFT